MRTGRSVSRGTKVFVASALVCAAAVVFAGQTRVAPAPEGGNGRGESNGPADVKNLKIDLGKSVKVKLPAPRRALVPVSFRTPDGRSGWVVRVPGNKPLATPAYERGRLFIGGGYGSHDFYAFDAKTGRLAWKTKTADDGTSASIQSSAAGPIRARAPRTARG